MRTVEEITVFHAGHYYILIKTSTQWSATKGEGPVSEKFIWASGKWVSLATEEWTQHRVVAFTTEGEADAYMIANFKKLKGG